MSAAGVPTAAEGVCGRPPLELEGSAVGAVTRTRTWCWGVPRDWRGARAAHSAVPGHDHEEL